MKYWNVFILCLKTYFTSCFWVLQSLKSSSAKNRICCILLTLVDIHRIYVVLFFPFLVNFRLLCCFYCIFQSVFVCAQNLACILQVKWIFVVTFPLNLCVLFFITACIRWVTARVCFMKALQASELTSVFVVGFFSVWCWCVSLWERA